MSVSDHEQRANALVQEAEKKLYSPKGILGGLFGGSDKQHEALECYIKAANLYKLAQNWSKAGQTFVTVAKHHSKYGYKIDSANSYIMAANCFKKCDPNEAVRSLSSAIEVYIEIGRFNNVAKLNERIAEIYLTDMADLERAMNHFEHSADWHKGEESRASVRRCLLKVALIAAQLEKYQKAIQIYEQVAASALDHSLIKYSAREYYFRATLCHLCIDPINAQNAITRYEAEFPAFDVGREAKFLKALIKHVEEEDLEAYNAEIEKYERVTRFDKWHTMLLQRIRKQLPDDEYDLC